MAQVLHTIEGRVATVVLANEAKYNAMSLGMWQQLGALLDQLGQDESVRVLVLRGQGDKAFVSGADIAEFEQQRSNPEGVAAYDRAVDQVQTALAQFPRPVIAAISGICFGGGLGMALSCDLRYCSAGSRFRMPAARLGLGYAWRGMQPRGGALSPPKKRATERFAADPAIAGCDRRDGWCHCAALRVHLWLCPASRSARPIGCDQDAMYALRHRTSSARRTSDARFERQHGFTTRLNPASSHARRARRPGAARGGH